MRIHNLIIGLLLFGLCIGVLVGISSELNDNLETNLTNESEEMLNKLKNETGQIIDYSDDIRDVTPGGNASGVDPEEPEFRDRMEKSGWKAISKFPVFLSSFQKSLGIIEEGLGINNRIFTNILFTAIMIILSLILLSAILRNRL